MNTAAAMTRALVLALLGLQWAWHAWLWPPANLPAWLPAVLYSLPLLPTLGLWALRRPQADFWAGVVALGYFSHGVMEAWANPSARPLAWLETLLAVALVVASSWNGLRARFARKA